MTDQNRQTMLSAISGAQGSGQPFGKLSKVQLAIRAFVIAVPIVGAMPTAMNIYHSWKHDIPYSEVSHRLAQYDLWTRNFDCKVDYKELVTAQGTKVNVGACPKSGDIAIKLATAGGQSKYEWIALDKLREPTKSAGLMEFIASSAIAEEAPKSSTSVGSQSVGASGTIRLALAGMEVVCQAKQGQSAIIRIVKEAGKCYREHFSPFQGRVDKREEVPCNTTCPASK